MKIGQYCQRQRCKHIESEQFWHAFASRGFVSDSWAFLLQLLQKSVLFIQDVFIPWHFSLFYLKKLTLKFSLCYRNVVITTNIWRSFLRLAELCQQRQRHNGGDRPCVLCGSRGVRRTQGAWTEARRSWHSSHRGQQEGIRQVSVLHYATVQLIQIIQIIFALLQSQA